jgi:hypothetical protein
MLANLENFCGVFSVVSIFVHNYNISGSAISRNTDQVGLGPENTNRQQFLYKIKMLKAALLPRKLSCQLIFDFLTF